MPRFFGGASSMLCYHPGGAFETLPPNSKQLRVHTHAAPTIRHEGHWTSVHMHTMLKFAITISEGNYMPLTLNQEGDALLLHVDAGMS